MLKKIIYLGRKGKSTNAIWFIVDWTDLVINPGTAVGAKKQALKGENIGPLLKKKFGADILSLFDICIDYSWEKTNTLSLSNKTTTNMYVLETLFSQCSTE